MKSERHGQAKVLTPAEIERLFAEGFRVCAIDRCLGCVCMGVVGLRKRARRKRVTCIRVRGG